MTASNRKRPILLIIGIILSLLIVGCSTNGSPSPVDTEPIASATPTDIPTSTPVPTSTPLPPVGVLLAAPDADPKTVRQVQGTMSSWARENGFRFQVLPELSSSDFQMDDYRWVVRLDCTNFWDGNLEVGENLQ